MDDFSAEEEETLNEFKKYRGYIVEVIDCERFVLKHHDQNQIECSIQQDSAGDLKWIGLPPELMKQMGKFNKEDIKKYPATILKTIISKINNPKQPLQDYKSIERQKENAVNIREENPSKYYKIIGKVGTGGFARVFSIKRTSDDKEFALKFIEPRNKEEKDDNVNEIGLQAISKHNSIV